MDRKRWSDCGVICLLCLFMISTSAELLIQQVTDQEQKNSPYKINTGLGVTRFVRDEPPSSRLLTIERFSIVHSRQQPYESAAFGAAGYTWRLVMYPTGEKADGGSDHISLYLRIEDTNSLPENWEVNVDLKLFVHNHKLNKYLTVTDGTIKRFNEGKTRWGFAQLIPLSTFHNRSEGYVVDDTCTFGAEIFVIEKLHERERVTYVQNPPNNMYIWVVHDFSKLQDRFYYSRDFLVGDRYWRLGFNPKGNGSGRGRALPIFLYAFGFAANASVSTTDGAVYLRLRNQRNQSYNQRYSAAWYPIRSGYGVGSASIISFQDLYDPSKGYLVNDSIVFEAEMPRVSVTKVVPN